MLCTWWRSPVGWVSKNPTDCHCADKGALLSLLTDHAVPRRAHKGPTGPSEIPTQSTHPSCTAIEHIRNVTQDTLSYRRGNEAVKAVSQGTLPAPTPMEPKRHFIPAGVWQAHAG